MTRWLLAWALWGIGHALSKTLRWNGCLYPPYSRIMVWSSYVQGDGPGPWENVDE